MTHESNSPAPSCGPSRKSRVVFSNSSAGARAKPRMSRSRFPSWEPTVPPHPMTARSRQGSLNAAASRSRRGAWRRSRSLTASTPSPCWPAASRNTSPCFPTTPGWWPTTGWMPLRPGTTAMRSCFWPSMSWRPATIRSCPGSSVWLLNPPTAKASWAPGATDSRCRMAGSADTAA